MKAATDAQSELIAASRLWVQGSNSMINQPYRTNGGRCLDERRERDDLCRCWRPSSVLAASGRSARTDRQPLPDGWPFQNAPQTSIVVMDGRLVEQVAQGFFEGIAHANLAKVCRLDGLRPGGSHIHSQRKRRSIHHCSKAILPISTQATANPYGKSAPGIPPTLIPSNPVRKLSGRKSP